MRIAGAVALVTGASSGIGKEVARALAGAGARVLASGRDGQRLAALEAATGATVLPADLREAGAAADLAERALGRYGQVDILVSNAGTGWAGRLAAMPETVGRDLLAVNLAAPVELTRALLPAMCRAGRGHLSYVSSIAGRLGVAEEAVYAASKAGLDVFARSLRLELAGHPIRVSVVVPGAVETEFFARRGRPYPRRRPRQQPAARVAAALVAAIAHDRAEVYVPGWLRLPVAIQAVVPGLYRRLATRFG